MIGQWPHWPRMFYLMGGLILLVVILGAVAMVAARRQASARAEQAQPKPPEQNGDKASADMVAAVSRPYNLITDPEQPRLPPMNGSPRDDENLKRRLAALEQQQQQDAEQRQRDAAEVRRLQDELNKKAKEKPKPDADAQRRAQEAKQAEKERAEALKARRNSGMSFFKDDSDTAKDKGIGKRVRPPYKHFLAAGSVVNCTIENGINTEHPAPVIARISGPVYDSVTGLEAEHLQDAVLLGDYKSVLFGDEAVTVTWNKLVYADGSEVPLEGQPGGNTLGRAGLPAEIDNKWGTSLFALVTGSVQRASTVGVSLMGNSPAERVIAASAGSAVSETGQKFQRTLNVSPTGYVEPGTPCTMTLKSALDLSQAVR